MKTKEIIISVVSVTVKIIVAIVVVMFIYKYATKSYDYGYRLFSETPVSNGEGLTITVTVGEDSSTREIGQMLENKGLIRDGMLFVFQELASEHHGEIKAGKYNLSTAMTAEEMITIMSGEELSDAEDDLMYNSDEDALTIPEDVLVPEEDLGMYDEGQESSEESTEDAQ